MKFFQAGRGEGRWFWGFTLLLVAAHVGLAMRQLSRPGIYFDEILLLMPVLDPARWQFTPAWSPIPFFMNFYIGGLRLWYAYPFTKFIPISVELLRVPNIVLYSLSLLVLARKYARCFSPGWALVIVGALALNANLMASARADFVPFLFGFLFRGWFLAWLFERGLARADLKSFLGGAALLAAGVFHRLDFLWAAAAMLGAGAVIEVATLRAEGAARAAGRIVALRVALLGGLALAVALVMSAQVQRAGEFGLDSTFGERFQLLWSRLESVLLGTSFLEYNLGPSFTPLPATLAFYLGLMAAPFFSSRGEKPFRVAAFCALYSLSLFGLMFFIRRVGTSWHMLLFEPMLGIWWATGAYALARVFPARRGLQWMVTGLVFGWLLVLQVHAYLGYQRIYALPDREISFLWNRALYSLVDFRRAHPAEYFVNLGWGTHQEAASLAFNRVQNDGGSFAALSVYLAAPGHSSALVVAPAARLDAQVGAEAEEVKQFREAVAAGRLKVELVQSIGDPGFPVYEIWRCRRP